MSHCVVSHVNCRVGKRFNNELSIPGEFGSETDSARTSPLLKPSENMNELLLGLIIIAVEIFRLDMGHYLVLPFFFSIVHHPLITESADACVSSSGNDFRLGLVVRHGITGCNHLFLDEYFGGFSFHSIAFALNGHNTISKALKVAFVFSFFKLVFILRSLNLSGLNGDLSAHISHTGDFDDGDRLERLDPFRLDFVIIGFLLEVSEHDEIIGRVRRN